MLFHLTQQSLKVEIEYPYFADINNKDIEALRSKVTYPEVQLFVDVGAGIWTHVS